MDVVKPVSGQLGWIGACSVLAAIVLATAVSAGQRDPPPAATKPAAGAKRTLSTEGLAKNRPSIPDGYKINLLIRTTIIAVNQANMTGNYSVLRELGAPGFQAANTAAQLAENFAKQRKSKFDLSPILFFDPKLVEKPSIEESGMLRLTGFFATRPQQVNFNLVFEYVDGEWRYFGLGIGTQLSAKSAAKR